MKKNNKGFVASAVLYPLLVLFLALIMGLLSMTDTRKRILDKMKLEISDSIFDEATCSCDTILNKLNYLIRNGLGEDGKKIVGDEFTEEKDYVKGDYAIKDNTLWKFTSNKPLGEWDESKVIQTSVTNELQTLNTEGVIYNSADDYLYINGQKWKYAGLKSQELIPLLTGYTGSNGKVIYYSDDYPNYAPPWKAFDRNNDTYGYGGYTGYIGYQFNQKVIINKVSFSYFNPSSTAYTITTQLQYYNGVSWIDVPGTSDTSYYGGSAYKSFIYELNNLEAFGIRVKTPGSQPMSSLKELQAYGVGF